MKTLARNTLPELTGPPAPCHPERRLGFAFSEAQSQSKDPVSAGGAADVVRNSHSHPDSTAIYETSPAPPR